MKLYVARHGDYFMDTTQQLDVLTENGINEMTVLANFLNPLNLQVSNILHSEKFRAQQSAEILAKGFHCEQAIQLQAGLNPNDDAKAFANEIAHWDVDVLIVSHLPFVGRLISELVTHNENNTMIDFKPGTLVCLEQLEHTRWIINWVLTPDFFRE